MSGRAVSHEPALRVDAGQLLVWAQERLAETQEVIQSNLPEEIPAGLVMEIVHCRQIIRLLGDLRERDPDLYRREYTVSASSR